MVKLDLYCGLLGTGKTTVIKQMLSTAYRGYKTAVIENEVGRVNLDSEELKRPEIAMREITSGCICCTVKGSFTAAIRQLVEEVHPDYIIVEPSGAADLSTVLESCLDADGIVLNRVVMVVNAKKILPLLSVGGQFLKEQIQLAHTIYLNFSEQLSQEQIRNVKKQLLVINSALMFVEKDIDQLNEKSFPEQQYPVPMFGPGKMKKVRKQARISVNGAISDSCDYLFSSNLSKSQLDALLELPAKIGVGNLCRMKGYFRMNDQSICKLDYAYGDSFLKKVSEVSVELLNHAVFIGERLNTSKIKKYCSEIDKL